jgi:tetratricopeptide (TPR) repeat protein
MRILFIAIVFCSTAFASFGQNHLVKSLEKGVEAHRRYSLVVCDTVLERVLDRKSELTKAQYGEALYFYTRNLMRMAIEIGETDNGFATLDVQLKIYRVYNNYLELEKANIPRWSQKAGPEIQSLLKTLLRASVNCLEVYVQEKGREHELKMLVEGYTNLAATITPEGYAPFELKGQLYYLKGDTAKALDYYKRAIKNYKSKRLLMADNIRIPTIYYALALQEIGSSNEKAYALARQGYKINEIEWSTIKVNAKQLGETVVEDNKAVYFNNQYNLGLLQLETAPAVLSNDSLLLIYEARIDYFKEVYSIQYNYAELLREVNPRKSSMHYQKAIDLNPNDPEAYFSMATLYFDMGYYYLNQAKKENSKENKEKAYQLLGVGVGNMESAHKLAPKDQTTLKWLIKVYRDVGENAKSKEYQAKLDALK